RRTRLPPHWAASRRSLPARGSLGAGRNPGRPCAPPRTRPPDPQRAASCRRESPAYRRLRGNARRAPGAPFPRGILHELSIRLLRVSPAVELLTILHIALQKYSPAQPSGVAHTAGVAWRAED